MNAWYWIDARIGIAIGFSIFIIALVFLVLVVFWIGYGVSYACLRLWRFITYRS